MDYFNIDPNENRLPPKEVRFKSLQVESYQDDNRLLVSIQLTPFQLPPCLELSIIDNQGVEVGSVSIIELPYWNHELTMHIRNKKKITQNFLLNARLFYFEEEDLDKQSIEVNIPRTSMR